MEGSIDERVETKVKIPRVLVVDDDNGIRVVTGRFLKRNGYDVLYATTGLEALDVLNEVTVDLVLTDVMMPEMRGYELESEMRSRGINTPVLYMSGTKQSNVPEVAGKANFLEKPFKNDDLTSKVREYIS